MEERLPFNKEVKKVDVPKEYRYVTPSVRLERRRITMLNPPPGQQQQQQQQEQQQQQQRQESPAPDSGAVSTSDDSSKTSIVGQKGPLEDRVPSPLLRAPSRNGQSPKQPVEEPQKEPPPPRTPTMKREPPEESGTTTSQEQRLKEEKPEMSKTTTVTPRTEEDETRTQEETGTQQERTQATKEATQVTRQELTKETQELSATRTTTTTTTAMTSTKLSGARTTSTTTKRESTTTTTAGAEGGRRSPAATKPAQSPARQVVEIPTSLPARLETAEVIEFFEEQASSRKNSGVQVAEQSEGHENSQNVVEFFQEQPVRQQSIQVAPQTTTREEASNVIEFFEEQDHSFDETSQPTLLVVPSPHQSGSFHHRSPRSPSPSSLHASVGLNHLDNLIRLMEQLSNLKDENVKLKKKCDYLETTKNLLKARSELMSTSDSSAASGFQSLPASKHHKGHHHHHHHHHRHGDGDRTREPRGGRPRLSSAEDVQYIEISESASDQRPKRPKGAMHKRSFSTGSLEVEILDETSTADGRAMGLTKSKSGKSVFSKSPKQKSKSSKWARVKKVLTGQFWYEDLGTTLKSLKEFGRSTQRYSTVSSEGHEFSSTGRLAGEPRSLDTSYDAEFLVPRLPRISPGSTPEAFSAGRSPQSVMGPGAGGGGPGGEEQGTEIWMGPPGWWEQYEARKRQSEASSASDVSSVIEVKTMYLGSKQKDTERLLKVKPLIRRQSSPSLISPKDTDEDGDGEEEGEGDSRFVHRSSSYKGEELDLPKDLSVSACSSKSSDSKKLHRKAWGRVKEMIHVRKDSAKKTRSRRSDKDRDREEWSQEETSEIDMEGLLEEHLAAEFGEGIMSRSTPKTSPMVMPRQTASKSFSESPPSQDPSSPFYKLGGSSGPDVAALLASSMSQEFAQKMQAWQELQLRKSSSFKTTTTETEGEVPGVDSFGAETQELLSSQNLEADRPRSKGASQSYPSLASGEVSLGGAEGTSPGISPSATTELSPIELLGPAANVEELQRRISESFSRKLTEWERRKFRRPTTPEMEQKNRSRKEKEEKSRSKKSREEKERDRLEKAREREMQKVEREQVKLEKEKVRIEKERQRAMEKQAKLERMKGRLSQADSEPPSSPSSPTPSSPTPAQDALAQYKVTADFKKKLHEWEQMKGPLAIPESGLSSDAGTPSPQPTTAPPSFSLGPTHDGTHQGQEGDRRKDSRPPPLTLHPCLPESPEDRSPVEKTSDVSYGDDNTSVTDESLTKSNIASLERANAQLLKEVQRKEHEYATLQEEVSKLNSKLDKVRQEHAAEMARFKRELESGVMTTPVQLEVGELESTVRELEEKIVLMEDAGDQLAESMESAAIGKWQSMESEEVVSQELVDMVDQMKGMLVQVAHSKEQTQKTTAMHNFENVYSHAMKLQVQMNNLRVSQLERNKEIMLIKRQLLLQEVNNVLLQAHITRRETELYQYREAKRHGTLRRWNTFSGQGDGQVRPPLLRNISMQDRDPPVQPFPPPSSSKAKHSAKHDDIHHVTDENASIPTPRVVAAGGQAGGPVAGGQITPSASCPIITMTAPTPEKSTDHREQYLTSPAASTTSTSTSNGTAAVAEQRRPGEQQGDRTPAPVLTGAATPAPASSRPATSGTQMTAPTSTTTTTTSAAAAATSGASKVETGSPTLLAQTSASSASATSPVTARHVQSADTETPAKPIPERQDAAGVGEASPSSPAKSASQADDNYSQTRAVMECTQSTDLDPQASGPPGGRGRGGGPPSPPSPSGPAGGVDIGHQPPPKTVRSPVSRQKYLRRQQEEREKKKERLASPKTAHKGDSGKPPPHPHTSPSTAPRSKSVGDMEGTEPDSSAHAAAPLREVIQKFEKRATVCETEERKIEFRKTPSPTLHLPRVGLVSRVRRLKPAAELLQESQRYRSGHSIYATRIMNRYLPARSPQPGVSPTQDKENVSDRTYVQAMVKKLSREGTPVKSPGSSSASSSLSLHRTDSPGSPGRSGRSELVSQLVHKLSSHSGSVDSPASSRKHPHPPSSSSLPAPSPSSPSSPLKDVTNEGQGKKLARSFSLEGEGEGRGQGPCDQHTLSASDLAASDRTKASQPAESVPGAPVSSTSEKTDSTISPGSLSMPALAFDPGEDPGDEAEARERAATYCVSEGERLRQQQQLRAQDSGGGESIEQIAEEFLDPTLLSIRASKGQKISPSSSTKSKNTLCCKSSACSKAKNSSSASSSSQSSGALKLPSSPKSQERKGIKEKMETIGVLCKQSMSFDLGVSRRTQPQEAMSRRPQSAESLTPSPGGGAEGGASDKPRPASTSSEGDAAAAAAAASATAASSDDKKKSSRSRFLDSSWLQKPKKFFKVSK
ncbi:pneumococcal serine-rich repeat protein-like isoform X2 [Littorina saxatilis]|uniref:pneumococcal serine-rich repeat protein-like isoform X2 n=1 Tax=Littorina saxatilis TaxID=31220 RepID=UPI0038B541AC